MKIGHGVVVEVEDRQRHHDVHVRVVVGPHRPDVAPVAAVAVGRAGHLVVLEVVDAGLVAADERRHDVAAHVVLGALMSESRVTASTSAWASNT